MNKTFKVIYNRARQGLMVANEITSSVQKKGTKTILATAALSLLAATSASATVFEWTSETLPEASYTTSFEQAIEGETLAVIEAKAGATGKISDLNIKASSLLANKKIRRLRFGGSSCETSPMLNWVVIR